MIPNSEVGGIWCIIFLSGLFCGKAVAPFHNLIPSSGPPTGCLMWDSILRIFMNGPGGGGKHPENPAGSPPSHPGEGEPL